MKSSKEIRIENLKHLIDEAGSRTIFTDREKAVELKIAYSYVGQLINGDRGIGDSTARKLEQIGGKEEFWLDTDHSKINPESLKEAMQSNDASTVAEMIVTGVKDDAFLTSDVNTVLGTTLQTSQDKQFIERYCNATPAIKAKLKEHFDYLEYQLKSK